VTHGQCLCGAVTFEIDVPDDHLGETRFCYCRECRRANGSMFSSNVPVPKDRYRMTAGQDNVTEYKSSPGTVRAFCTTRGSPVYAHTDQAPDMIRIRLGTLDEPAKATPIAHAWVSEKPEWHDIAGDLPQSPQGYTAS
jgi:hypothetical protein